MFWGQSLGREKTVVGVAPGATTTTACCYGVVVGVVLGAVLGVVGVDGVVPPPVPVPPEPVPVPPLVPAPLPVPVLPEPVLPLPVPMLPEPVPPIPLRSSLTSSCFSAVDMLWNVRRSAADRFAMRLVSACCSAGDRPDIMPDMLPAPDMPLLPPPWRPLPVVPV